MIDMRRKRERRKGEKDGSFSWAGVIDIFIVIVIAVGIAWTGFMLGRHYESVSKQDTVTPAAIWKDFKASRVAGH